MTAAHSQKKAATSALNSVSATWTNSEALHAATFLVGQFPNSAKGDEIFLRSLAALLQTFPPSVVEDCINPQSGIATTIAFISLADVANWCAHHAERFYQHSEKQKRISQQLAERTNLKPRTEHGIAITKAWLSRTGPFFADETFGLPKVKHG